MTSGFPLSFGQQRLWLIDQLRPGGTEYAVPVGWRLYGDLEPGVLRRALDALVARHDVLRTRYPSPDGVPMQAVDPPGGPEWAMVDLSEFPAAARESRLAELIDKIVGRPFALAEEWPVRARLFRLGVDEHVLLLVLHHIVSDGWSLDLLARDLGELYRAETGGEVADLPELPLRYADFARWQRDALTGQVVERDLTYWRDRLADLEPLELPADRPRPAAWRAEGGTVRFTVPAPVARAVTELGRAERATPFMTLLAGFLVLTARYTGRSDLAVGTPLAGRNRPDVRDLIGLFVNTVVIRARLAGRMSFRQVLGRVRAACVEAYLHQDLPFERVVAELAAERDLSRNPLFQIMFSVANGTRRALRMPGLRVEDEPMDNSGAMFDLTVELAEQPDRGLLGLITYSSALFDLSTVECLAASFGQLLAAAGAAPDVPVGRLELLTGRAREEVLVGWNRTAIERPALCVHELVARQAAATPDAPAVVGPSGRLTYARLDRRANGLAHRLRALGVGPEARVGVCLRRGVDLVVALLAVLKAGGAYVPVDPDQPARRTAHVLSDAGVSVVLGDHTLAGWLPNGVRLVAPDEAAPAGPPEPDVTPDNLLYVLYTSGSTGAPKGTLITHRAMVNRVLWGAAHHLRADDRVLHKTALTFDAAGWELWAPLAVGGTIAVAEPGAERDPSAIVRSVIDRGATVLQVVPSMLRLLVDEPGLAGCTSLRAIFAGGQPLTADLCERLAAKLDVELHNLYGPTECTIDVTSWRFRRGQAPAIGVPIHNTRVYVLDADGAALPVGVPGELYVGGAGLARGYLGRPALTAERFVPDPFGAGRLYRTGDLVRWRPDGNLEFVGRLDDQVKVGGVRIEPGEIESVLARHPEVSGVAVTARTDHRGDAFLVAYVEPAGVDARRVREFAASNLPATMVPAQVVALDRLPRTTGGKVDRSALPAPRVRSDRMYVRPRGETERRVAEILAEELGVERVGLRDDFFRLGGHSLLAIRTASRLRAELSADLPVRLLFEAPTVERIARMVRTAAAREVPIPPAPRDVPPPASSGQQRLWFIDRLRPGLPEYIVPAAWRLRGPLQVESLRRALRELAARHEVLRTRCDLIDGALVQLIDPPEAVSLRELAAPGAIDRFPATVATRPFRLGEQVPMRATLARIGTDDHLLVLSLHHIACDARSMDVIRRELGELYVSRRLPPLPVRFADFAAWERAWLNTGEAAAQLEFWRGRLDGLVPLELPTDRPRPAHRDAEGATVEVRVPATLARTITGIGREEGATPFMTMLAAFGLLLAKYTGRDDVAVGTTVSGRPHSALAGLVGPFMNSVVLRADLAGCRHFVDVVRRVRDTVRGAFANQDLPFERLVNELKPHRDPDRNPLFAVLFELEPHSDPDFRLGPVTAEPVPVGMRVAKLDLTLHLDEQEDGSYAGTVEYATALFERTTIERLVADFLRVVERAAAGPWEPLAVDAAPPDTAGRPVARLLAGREYSAPDTPTERIVAGIWLEVLDVDRVGVHDNFFELGGHSLLATQVHLRIQEEFDVDLPLRTLFEARTVRELAAAIEAAVHDEIAVMSDADVGAVLTEGGPG